MFIYIKILGHFLEFCIYFFTYLINKYALKMCIEFISNFRVLANIQKNKIPSTKTQLTKYKKFDIHKHT